MQSNFFIPTITGMKIPKAIFLASFFLTLSFTQEDEGIESSTVRNAATASYEGNASTYLPDGPTTAVTETPSTEGDPMLTYSTEAIDTTFQSDSAAVTETPSPEAIDTTFQSDSTAVTETPSTEAIDTTFQSDSTAVTETPSTEAIDTTFQSDSATVTETPSTEGDPMLTYSTEAIDTIFSIDGPTATVTVSDRVTTMTVTDSLLVEVSTITVPMPPSIILGPPKNLIYRSGESVTLNCKGKGVPDVTYEWKKDGITLNQTLQNIHRGADGTITINPATSVDEGFYQCFARNEYGTALSKTAHLQMAFLGSTTRNSTDVLNKTVQEGKSFHIPCDAPSSFPKPTHGWDMANDIEDENAIPLLPSKRIQIAANGDLHFAYALPEDDIGGRIYRCTTNNSYLGVEAKGGYTILTVTRTGNISQVAPTLAFSSSEHPKGNSTFRCFFYGYPEPTIIWTGPNDTFPTGRYTLNPFNTSLTINNLQYSDEGDYNCTASNVKGSSTYTRRLLVWDAPTFPNETDGPSYVSVTEGESITFNCNATAKPVARIVWLQDGKELDPDNPPIRFVFSNDNRSLTIKNVCRDCDYRENKTDQTVIQCNASNVHGYAFASGYLNILRKFCDDDLDANNSITWSRTTVGTEISQPCPGKRYGLCSRKCSLNSDGKTRWSPPNCNLCYDEKFGDLQKRVTDLNATALKNQTVVAEIANQLSILTNKSEDLNPGNLNASVKMLNQLADLRRGSKDSPNEKELESFVQATSNVLQTNNFKEWKTLEAVNETFATAILFSVDVYGLSLSMLNPSGCNKKDAKNLFLEAWSMEASSLPSPSEFPNCSAWDENKISISMEIPNSSISSERFQQPTKVWASYYPTIHNFLPENKVFGNVASKVLSLSTDGKTNEALKYKVNITFRHDPALQEGNMSFIRTCAFWNFNRSDWDSEGCSLNPSNSTHTICSCDHLTNFAVLMRISNASMTTHASEDKALSMISIIGCSISVAALILTIIVYALTWKHSKSAQAAVLLNLCVALIIGYIIFMVGADKVKPQVGCTVVAVLLHYFFLAAFFIMLIEGVELLIYIIFVFHVRRTIETVMLIASAWVLPLIIVAVSTGYTKLVGYGNYGNVGNETNFKHCWLDVENRLIWAFVGPVLSIIAVNFIILIIVLIWMSRRRSFLANNAKKRSEIRATIWNLSVTCPVLGLGWVLGVFLLGFDHVIIEYVFVITNSLQGLFIFIFHALLHNKKVKEKISSVYSNYICGCRKTVYEVSDKMSSTQELAKKTEKPGFVPMEVHDNKGMEKQDILLSTGTQTTSIDDSGTLESTH